jgi:septum formation protein
MIPHILNDYELILVSASPRRRQLMKEAGFVFRTGAVDYDEVWPPELKGSKIAEYLAGGKADAWKEKIRPCQIIITADTIVWCHGEILGKPSGPEEAAHFLRLLSGCEHEVITALCLSDSNRKHIFSVSTRVTFRELSEEEISFYIEKYRPFDKAGAYGIQEWIGLRGITRIDGSYYNVVGMPVSDLYSELLLFTGNKTKII